MAVWLMLIGVIIFGFVISSSQCASGYALLQPVAPSFVSDFECSSSSGHPLLARSCSGHIQVQCDLILCNLCGLKLRKLYAKHGVGQDHCNFAAD